MMTVDGSGAVPCGHVQPDGPDRAGDAPADHAGHGLHLDRRHQLRRVESTHVVDRDAQRDALVLAQRGLGGIELGRGDAQRAERTPSKRSAKRKSAASPSRRTSAMIRATSADRVSRRAASGRASAARRPASSSAAQR
jgi:hypothetical protein